MREYRQTPKVEHVINSPSTIVLIIGESFSKLHSSLYGYEKQTNPYLSRLSNEGQLTIYDNIKSSATYTVMSFRGMMMSYAEDICNDTDWYRRLTIFDVMRSAGYRTYWISNQYKLDEIGRYSLLSDESYFVSDYNSILEDSFDEMVFPLIERCKQSKEYNTNNRFIIVHLSGSHVDYIKRYPKDYSQFKTDEYNESHQHLTQENRTILAEYDNSVLYNDFIVYSIMQQFQNEDAIVFYLSDHGEELFESNNEFFGHGVTSNPEIVLNVPFMIHTTPLFKEHRQLLQERIEESLHNEYRLDSLMYTVMDIAGIEKVDGVSYKHKSVFN